MRFKVICGEGVTITSASENLNMRFREEIVGDGWVLHGDTNITNASGVWRVWQTFVHYTTSEPKLQDDDKDSSELAPF